MQLRDGDNSHGMGTTGAIQSLPPDVPAGSSGVAASRLLRRPSGRVLVLIALVVLTLLVIVRGVIPATRQIDSDFPNYLTAARIVAGHGPTERLYDDAWFLGEIHAYLGSDAVGRFAPFPPPTALVLVPIAGLEPLNALRVMTVASVGCLVLSIVLLARLLAWDRLETALFVLASGHAIFNGLRLGQIYILVATTCILGYYACARGRQVRGGLWLGLFLPIKYFPLTIVAALALVKSWRAVAGAAISAVSVIGLSILILGWDIHRQFLDSVLGRHLLLHIRGQSEFATAYQSFDTLFRRLFTFDAAENPTPPWPIPWLAGPLTALTKAALVLAAVAVLTRLLRREPHALAPCVGILALLTLLIAPGTATYHFVLLWLPVGLLSVHLLRRHARWAALSILLLYALIGLLPFSHLLGSDTPVLLAYPRLAMLLTMFIVASVTLWRSDEATAQGADQRNASQF